MQEEKNKSLGRPDLALCINVSKMCEKNWESVILLVFYVMFEFDYKDGLIGDLCDSGWQLVTICE